MNKEKDPEAVSGGAAGREPQSYGSESDWLTGKTGQTVDDTPGRAARHDEEFYENRHEPEGETPAAAAETDEQENRAHPDTEAADGDAERTKAGEELGGRESYFKDRDYGKS